MRSFLTHYPKSLGLYLLIGGSLAGAGWLYCLGLMIWISFTYGVPPYGGVPGINLAVLASALLGIPILSSVAFVFPGLLWYDWPHSIAAQRASRSN